MGKILTIDTGGTKTRIAQFVEISNVKDAFNAPVLHEIEFPTPYNPDEYIAKVAEVISGNFSDFFRSGDDDLIVLAIRGIVENGSVSDPKLGWHGFPVAEKLHSAIGKKVLVENDSKLGTLGAFPPDFSGRGLYLTIGTGVGSGLLIDGELSRDMAKSEVGYMRFWFANNWTTWQEVVSGTGFYARYGKHGDETGFNDPIWREYAENLSSGIAMLLPIFYPDEIIIGGGIVNQFPYYGEMLQRLVLEKTTPLSHRGLLKISAAHDPKYTVNRGALIYALKNPDLAL